MEVDLYMIEFHVQRTLELGIDPLTGNKWHGSPDEWYKAGDGHNWDRVVDSIPNLWFPDIVEPKSSKPLIEHAAKVCAESEKIQNIPFKHFKQIQRSDT